MHIINKIGNDNRFAHIVDTCTKWLLFILTLIASAVICVLVEFRAQRPVNTHACIHRGKWPI